MFVSCAHLVAVLNAAFSVTSSLFMLVEDTRSDHMEESYSRAIIIHLTDIQSMSGFPFGF